MAVFYVCHKILWKLIKFNKMSPKKMFLPFIGRFSKNHPSSNNIRRVMLNWMWQVHNSLATIMWRHHYHTDHRNFAKSTFLKPVCHAEKKIVYKLFAVNEVHKSCPNSWTVGSFEQIKSSKHSLSLPNWHVSMRYFKKLKWRVKIRYLKNNES